MHFLILSFKKNDPKFEKTWDHRIPVWNVSYHMVKTFFFLSESRQKQGRQESKAGRNRTKSQRSGFVFLRYLKSVRLVRNTGQTEAKFQRQA